MEAPSFGLNDFPDEILLNIGKRLSVMPKKALGLTCKQFFAFMLDKELSPLNQHHALYSHQETAVEWFTEREAAGKGGILVIPVGLGKTLSTLYFIATTKRRTLVIAPISLLPQWVDEIKKFFGDKHNMKYYVYHPSYDKKYRGTDLTRFDIVITAKTIIARDDLEFRIMKPERIIIDEVHKVNSGTRYFDRLKRLQCHKFGLTATAYTRRETGLSPTILAQLDAGSEEESGFKVIRREDTECRRNTIVEHTQAVELDDPEGYWEYYNRMRSHMRVRAYMSARFELDVILSLRWMPRPLYYDRGELVYNEAAPNRRAALLALLKQYEELGKKCIVYFRNFPKKIEKFLTANDITPCCFTGVSRERVKALKQFRETHDVLLTTYQHAAEGLNIQSASVVIFHDLPPSPRDRIQAIGRTDRIGQTDTINVHTLYYRGTIEEHFVRNPRLMGISMEALAMDFYYRETTGVGMADGLV